ncbi:MAG: FadR family transcriptional regulator [Alphaproteobacteria bacterium]|nr:FadR family transcriptional regulator [Alphaproteobacteria bacterium]
MANAASGVSGESAGLVGTTIGAITELIRTNELGPGDKLPSEAQLSRDLKVSRTVVREAFRSLSALRLIELSTGRRATVAELDYGALAPVMEHGVHTEQISIQQIYDVRRTIESRTATLAALRRSDDQGREILAHAAAMREHADAPEKMMEHDLAFHIAIAGAAKNPVFALIVGAFEGITRQTWLIGWRSRTNPVDKDFMTDLHSEIAKAIVAGDPLRASELMAKHFDESVRTLIAAGIS